MDRREKLPRFRNAPLNELIVGVQFETPDAYSQVHISEVRQLFRSDYPAVSENVPIDPSFELFGGPPSQPDIGFKLLNQPEHLRYWFLTEDGSELVQFQNDRILHNWRVASNHNKNYPHLDTILSKFKDELSKLDEYFKSLNASAELKIIQFELSYVNAIPIDKMSVPNPGLWFNLFKSSSLRAEYFQYNFSEVVMNNPDEPARFRFDLKTARKADGEMAFIVTLSLKGAPGDHSINACVESLYAARKVMIRKFDDMITREAKRKWERYVG